MDNFRALPKLNEKLEEMVSSGEARLATVVASYGNEVEVIVTGGARARFPSTHIGVPVGSSGALIATRGGGRLFIPMGITIPIPFSSTIVGQSTTTVGNIVYFAASPKTLEPGIYRADGMAMMPVRRSAAGDMNVGVRIGGTTAATRYVHTAGFAGTELMLPVTLPFDNVHFTVGESGTVAMEYGISLHSAAGTVQLYMAVMSGTFTRIS